MLVGVYAGAVTLQQRAGSQEVHVLARPQFTCWRAHKRLSKRGEVGERRLPLRLWAG